MGQCGITDPGEHMYADPGEHTWDCIGLHTYIRNYLHTPTWQARPLFSLSSFTPPHSPSLQLGAASVLPWRCILPAHGAHCGATGESVLQHIDQGRGWAVGRRLGEWEGGKGERGEGGG
jgi:hypothetical protein